jgi:beta-1,4-mannosyl-glycoprotein beta-1,4-N-acetylglucosaminyltransferase
MIYDCFRYFNEEEVVEIRMEILDKWVDKFVVTECSVAHNGLPIPQRFPDLLKGKLSKFAHKVIYNYVTNSPTGLDPFERDAWQRERSLDLIRNCNDDDIVLMSDLDEIPDLSEESFDLCRQHGLVHFRHEMFMYFLNLHKESGWYGTRMMTGKFVKPNHSRQIRDHMRDQGVSYFGGWHWTFIGGHQRMTEKIESYCHQEFNNALIKSYLKKNVQEERDIFFRYGDQKFQLWEFDERFPDFVRNNRDRFNSLIKVS